MLPKTMTKYQFEILYKNDGYYLCLNNIDGKVESECGHMTSEEMEKYLSEEEDRMFQDAWLEDVLFDTREEAVYYLHSALVDGYEEWSYGELYPPMLRPTTYQKAKDADRWVIGNIDAVITLRKREYAI